MSVLVDVRPRFTDATGRPYVGATVYFGKPDVDTKLNPIDVYGDINQTQNLGSSVQTDDHGRTVNPVYVFEPFSYLVEDAAGNQVEHMPYALGASPEPDPVVVPVRKLQLHGFEPERLDGDRLRIFPGYCVDGEVSPTEPFESTVFIEVNMRVTGKSGLDDGSPVIGEDYFPYLIKNPNTGEVACVCSASISVNRVVLPTGFTKIRKLPFGFIWMAADGATAEGIQPYHLAGWPAPTITYTQMHDAAPYDVLVDGAVTTFTSVSMAGLIPDNARQVILSTELRVPGRRPWLTSERQGRGQRQADRLRAGHFRLQELQRSADEGNVRSSFELPSHGRYWSG